MCGTVDGTEISTWDVKDIVDLIVGPQVRPHSALPFLPLSPFPDVKDNVGLVVGLQVRSHIRAVAHTAGIIRAAGNRNASRRPILSLSPS